MEERRPVLLTEPHILKIVKCFESFIDQVSEMFHLDEDYFDAKVQEHLGKYTQTLSNAVFEFHPMLNLSIPEELEERKDEIEKDYDIMLSQLRYRKDQNLDELKETLATAFRLFEEIHDDNGSSFIFESGS